MPLIGCPLCDRESLLIYPVRYAIACPRGAAKAPALSGNFKVDGRAPQSAGSAKYTLRALRQGYLYTYDEKRKTLLAYMILDNGILYKFVPDIPPPPANAVDTNTCPLSGDESESYGRCVGVKHTPGSDEATNFWIGWSNVQWTRDLVHKKINDAAWRKQHMQCINVPAMLAGSASDTGEFQATLGKIAHFALDERAMKDAFGFSNRTPKNESLLRQHDVAKLIGEVMTDSPLKKGFVLAVNDPVGITNDLAELTVPSLNSGFDAQIYWKYISAQLLERAEAGIRGNAKAETGLTYGISKTIADANAVNTANAQAGIPTMGGPMPDIVGTYHLVRSWIKTGSFDQAAKLEDQKAANIPATQQQAADEAWEEASTKVGPDGKRTSVIDEDALKSFPQEYQHALDAFKPKWQPLVQAHANWLQSQLLADWMAGNHDVNDLRSGYAYSESCAQVIGTAAGTDACQKVLDDWLNGPASDTRNLYVRALMFNQDDLMKAADAQVHGSDIQYENFLNIYKQAYKNIEKLGNAANLRDRLAVTTANKIVGVLTKGVKGAAVGYVTIRLAMQSGVTIKAAQVSQSAMRKWLLGQADALGLKLDGDRLQQNANAANVSKTVLKSAPPSDSAVYAYQLDTDALVKAGELDASEVKAIRLPGVETTRKWLDSSREFNLGIVTTIFQMATLTFAFKDLSGSDQFNKGENSLKFAGAGVSVLGNIIETASETIKNVPEHPLSSFLMKQWSGVEHVAEKGATFGRGIGAVAGLVLAGYDLIFNAREAWDNGEKTLARLYVASGILGGYLAVASFFSLPFFWPVLIAAILIGIAIAFYKASEIKDWISRCRFSKGEHYHSLDDELKAFNSAMGA